MQNDIIYFRTLDGHARSIPLDIFIADYESAYDEMYEYEGKHGETIPGYDFLVAYFDANKNAFGDFQNLLSEFCRVRLDCVSSDREAAAFVAALGKQIC